MRLFWRTLLCFLVVSGMTFAATNPTPKKHKSNAAKLTKANAAEKESVSTPEVENAGMPPALAKHLERLRAMPGHGGLGGPGTPEDEAFLFKAYPDTDIPLARFDTARAAMQSLNGRPFARGKGKKGTWVTVGPSNAVYPLFPFRTFTSYVPAQYVASGRTTTPGDFEHMRAGTLPFVGSAGWRRRVASG